MRAAITCLACLMLNIGVAAADAPDAAPAPATTMAPTGATYLAALRAQFKSGLKDCSEVLPRREVSWSEDSAPLEALLGKGQRIRYQLLLLACERDNVKLKLDNYWQISKQQIAADREWSELNDRHKADNEALSRRSYDYRHQCVGTDLDAGQKADCDKDKAALEAEYRQVTTKYARMSAISSNAQLDRQFFHEVEGDTNLGEGLLNTQRAASVLYETEVEERRAWLSEVQAFLASKETADDAKKAGCPTIKPAGLKDTQLDDLSTQVLKCLDTLELLEYGD